MVIMGVGGKKKSFFGEKMPVMNWKKGMFGGIIEDSYTFLGRFQ